MLLVRRMVRRRLLFWRMLGMCLQRGLQSDAVLIVHDRSGLLLRTVHSGFGQWRCDLHSVRTAMPVFVLRRLLAMLAVFLRHNRSSSARMRFVRWNGFQLQ